MLPNFDQCRNTEETNLVRISLTAWWNFWPHGETYSTHNLYFKLSVLHLRSNLLIPESMVKSADRTIYFHPTTHIIEPCPTICIVKPHPPINIIKPQSIYYQTSFHNQYYQICLPYNYTCSFCLFLKKAHLYWRVSSQLQYCLPMPKWPFMYVSSR